MSARNTSAAVVLTCILCSVAGAGQLPSLNRTWQNPVVLVRDDGRLYILADRDPSPDGYVVELYDPKSGSVDLPLRPPVSSSGRFGSTNQVVLSGNRLLICQFTVCQLFLPSTNQWQAQNVPGSTGTPLVLLDDGKILRAGGVGAIFGTSEGYLIDSTTLQSIARADLNARRDGPAMVKLNDGRVLAAGGATHTLSATLPTNSAEIYDPTTQRWTLVAPPGLMFSATGYLLPDGRALIAGIVLSNSTGPGILLYDPDNNQWSKLGTFRPTAGAATTFFPNGTFLVSGATSTSVYDPLTGVSRDGRPMRIARTNHVTALLPDGGVLAFAGLGADGTPTKSVEQIYYGESQITASLDPGFYVVSTTQDQWSTNGLWGVDVQNVGGFEGGWHFGGLLPAAGKDVGFASFSLAAPGTVTANVNLQGLPGTSGPLEFTLQLLDADKKLVAGPVTGLGNLQWSQALQPGFYIVEVRSSSRAPAAAFQVSLLAPHLAPGASGGAALDRAAGVAGFVGFYLSTRQDVQIKLYNENTYGRPRGVGEVTLTLYDAAGRRLQAVGPDAP